MKSLPLDGDTEERVFGTTVTYTCHEGYKYWHDEFDEDDDTRSETAWCSHTQQWWNCVDGVCTADNPTPTCGSK